MMLKHEAEGFELKAGGVAPRGQAANPVGSSING
jgi:hypothetical protein